MDKRKETKLNDAYGVLFESHGMAKRNKLCFTLTGIMWLGMAVFHLVCFLNAFQEPEARIEWPPYEAREEGEMGLSKVHQVSKGQMFTDLIVCCGTGGIGIFSIAAVIHGRKPYLKIYESHVEGCAGFSLMAEEVRMPINRVLYISSHAKEMMPFAEIYTDCGTRVTFFMSAKKADEAERVFRKQIQGKEREADSLPNWPGI